MHTYRTTASAPRREWKTITVLTHASGYSVYEAEERFWRERFAEGALRIAGVLLILAGYVQWFIPAEALQGNPVAARMALSVLFIGTGVGIYIFASRGFRKVLHVDLSNRSVGHARVNTKNRSLVRRDLPMGDIESVFVKRAEERHGLATLNLRTKKAPWISTVLRGAQEELEDLHQVICQDVRVALDCSPRRVRRSAPSRAVPTPRPPRLQPRQAHAIPAQ